MKKPHTGIFHNVPTKPAAHVCKHGLCDHKGQCDCAECRPRTAHTPVPWEHSSGAIVKQYEDGKGFTIAQCYMEHNGTANAAFIVLAVNAHEELLSLVKHFVSYAPKDGTIRKRLNKAIDKAEGR